MEIKNYFKIRGKIDFKIIRKNGQIEEWSVNNFKHKDIP